MIGGSPCNDLSIVNPARKGLYGRCCAHPATSAGAFAHRPPVGCFCPGTATPGAPVPLALPVPEPHRCLQTAPLTAFSSASQRALAGSSLSSTASCMTRGPRREMTAPSSGSLRMWWPWALVTRGTSRDFSRYSQHPWFGQLTNGFRLGPPLYPCLICIVELRTEDFRFAGGPFGRLEASQLDREEALLEAIPERARGLTLRGGIWAWALGLEGSDY